MPVFRVRCSFNTHFDLFVEAPDEQAIYDVTDKEDFDPEGYPHKLGQDWSQLQPVDVTPTQEKAALKLEEGDFVRIPQGATILKFPG